MKIALIYPPTCDPTAPYLAVPALTGFMRANGVEVLPIDANVEAYDELLRQEPMAALRGHIEDRIARLEERAGARPRRAARIPRPVAGGGDAHAVPEGIDEAVCATLHVIRSGSSTVSCTRARSTRSTPGSA